MFAASAFALVTIAAVATSSQAQTVESVLAANHAAVGDMPAAGAAEFDYGYASAGLRGVQRIKFDLATGAFTEVDDSNGIRFANGYDGKVPWQEDLSGTFTPQEGGDRIPVAVSTSYRYANLWWTLHRRQCVGRRCPVRLLRSSAGRGRLDRQSARDVQYRHRFALGD
jgi:hypothetical protein